MQSPGRPKLSNCNLLVFNSWLYFKIIPVLFTRYKTIILNVVTQAALFLRPGGKSQCYMGRLWLTLLDMQNQGKVHLHASFTRVHLYTTCSTTAVPGLIPATQSGAILKESSFCQFPFCLSLSLSLFLKYLFMAVLGVLVHATQCSTTEPCSRLCLFLLFATWGQTVTTWSLRNDCHIHSLNLACAFWNHYFSYL
jgi:hypothetical protein